MMLAHDSLFTLRLGEKVEELVRKQKTHEFLNFVA
jgi:hypothetical protein